MLEPVFISVAYRLGGPFPVTLRCFYLKYVQYSCVKAPCVTKKFLAHTASQPMNTDSYFFAERDFLYFSLSQLEMKSLAASPIVWRVYPDFSM